MQNSLIQEVKNLQLNLPLMLQAHLKCLRTLLAITHQRTLTPQEIEKAMACLEQCSLLAKTEISILLWKIENRAK